MLVGCGCVGVGVCGGLCVQTVVCQCQVPSDGVEGDSDSDSDKKNGRALFVKYK